MSGIAIIRHCDEQPVAQAELETLLQAMAWRGPDQQGAWVQGGVALGAVQLWTTSEDWGTLQPVQSPNGDRLVLDGRLDNRPELIHALHLPPQQASTWSDAHLLLAAYQRWGKACVDHLAGAFAFALWDAAHHRLVCARDPLGMRSFFYHWDGRHFYAASTLQALRRLNNLTFHLNDEYVWDFLTTTFAGCFDSQATPFREVQRLPGGHVLIVDGSGLQVQRYWHPWELAPIRYVDDREYATHYRRVFETVVAAQCRAAGPVGVALSGGLDSSSVLCVALEMAQAGRIPAPDFHTFTLMFNPALERVGGNIVSKPLLDAVIAKTGVPHHPLVAYDWLPMFEDIPYRGRVPQDEPYILPSRPYRNMGIKVKQARPDVKVMLTGLGADETMSTSLFFVADWLRAGRVRDAFQVVKHMAGASSYSHSQIWFNLVLGGWGPRSLAYRLHERLGGKGGLALHFRFHFRIPSWLPDGELLARRNLKRLRLIPDNFSGASARAAFERSVLLMGDNVRLWDDQYMGLAAGIEMRHPFYDRRLVEFVLRLPTEQKLGRAGRGKQVLRQAMVDTIPKMPKEAQADLGPGFVYVYRESLKQQWSALENLFRDSRVAQAGYIEPKTYLQELGAKRSGPGNATDIAVMSTLSLEFWLRELEQPHPPLGSRPVPAITRPEMQLEETG
jgi:asparagine synthase (glutamine-hydrolysing)